MEYQKSIIQDQLSVQYPVDTVELDGKKYIKVKDYMYDITMVLGKGSYGTVYLGYAVEEGKEMNDLLKVAIKKITIPDSAERKEEINRILKSTETELFALMSFSNNMHILRLYDFVRSQEEGAVYIILEYCNHKDLQSYLKVQRAKYPICILEIRYYFMQILKGFKDLHSKMFLHRDVKPQNILVSNGVIKIADFGFAQKFDEVGQQRQTFAGTLQTAAPQIVLHIPYTDKCDIYSLGVILYWMIFEKYPIREIVTKQDYQKPLVFPNQPEVQDNVKELISKMMMFQEDDRISWEQLFSHDLFNEQIILETFKIKPDVPKPLSYADRVSSLRYTTKRNRINDAVPSRASVWLAGLINKQYQIDESLEKYEQNLQSQIKFQIGKLEVLKMISETVHKYSPQNVSLDLDSNQKIIFLKQIVGYAIESIITSSLKRIKKQICLQIPLEIFNRQDIEAINLTDQYHNIVQDIEQKLKMKQAQHKLYTNNSTQKLSVQTQKYKLDEVINWVLRPYNMHPKKFQAELKKIIIQLILHLKPEIVSMEIKPSKQSVILVHQLFLFFMKEQIFKKSIANKINFNYFFEKQERNKSAEGFQYLFMQVRGLVESFKQK